MWVRTMFNGDENCYVKLAQHAVYEQALWAIIRPCQEHMAFACQLFGDNREEEMGVKVDGYYYLPFRDPHDVLAAVWRYRFASMPLQLELPLKLFIPPKGDLIGRWLWERKLMAMGNIYAKEASIERTSDRWLNWLREEVQTWKHDPHLVRYIMKILTNQFQPEGYKAASALAWRLKERFDDVPWTED